MLHVRMCVPCQQFRAVQTAILDVGRRYNLRLQAWISYLSFVVLSLIVFALAVVLVDGSTHATFSRAECILVVCSALFNVRTSQALLPRLLHLPAPKQCSPLPAFRAQLKLCPLSTSDAAEDPIA